MKLPPELASFDSASGMLVALARFLHGRGTPPLGSPAGRALLPVAALARHLPAPVRQEIYSMASGREGQRPERLAGLDFERVAAAVTNAYPRRGFPAVAVGSSSGALVHLCAALGIPWLPQTLLVPVRQRTVAPDDTAAAAHAFDATAEAMLAGNPDLVLHHMHDPNQDRLTLRRMAYFRVKKLRLGPAYEKFLADVLRPGGVVLLAECRQRWPTSRLGARHVFQLGAVGGMSPEQYQERWAGPPPDGHSPEAEWGFEDALAADVLQAASRSGYRVLRLAFDAPEDLSPLVADLYRWWYAERGISDRRLLVDSFMLLDPWWTLRTGCVPYWSVFPVRPSVASIGQYLIGGADFDEILLALFCHGVESVGLATVDDLRAVLSRARVRGWFAGVSPELYPSDLGTFFGFQRALRALPDRHPIPQPMPVDTFLSFHQRNHESYPGVRLSIDG